MRACGLTSPGAHRASHRPAAPAGTGWRPLRYERHRPEQTALYRLVQQHAAGFIAHTEASTGAESPRFIKDEFDAFMECGILAQGFLMFRCGECGHDKLLAFSCKQRGFCPSCGARRMSQTAAHLVEHVIPHPPVRQWVLSLPVPLRVLLAAQPELQVTTLTLRNGPTCPCRFNLASTTPYLASAAKARCSPPGAGAGKHRVENVDE